jgi:hypothetical protein
MSFFFMDILVSDHWDSGWAAAVFICSCSGQVSVITSCDFDSKQDAEVPDQLIEPTITYIARTTYLEKYRFILT